MDLAAIGRDNLKGHGLSLYCGEAGALSPNNGHWEALRIILIEDGSGIIKIENRRYYFNSPVVFCFREQDVFEFENCTNCHARALWFHPDIINTSFDLPYCHRQEGFTDLLGIGPDTAKHISELLKYIQSQLALQSDVYCSCKSRSSIIELLFLLSSLRVHPKQIEHITPPIQKDIVYEVIRYLHTNYSKKITLTHLTRKFYINRTSLGRDFHETTGTTIMAYLMKLRLCLASHLLKETSLPVCEIYERVGFHDAAHFGRQFRKQFGISPSEYRRHNSWLIAV